MRLMPIDYRLPHRPTVRLFLMNHGQNFMDIMLILYQKVAGYGHNEKKEVLYFVRA